METENQLIRTLLAEPAPDQHTQAAARRRLTDEISGVRPARRRAFTWRLSPAGSGLAAVAAAGVAIALAAGSTGTAGLGQTGGSGATGVAAPPAGPTAEAGAPQLLLAAAEQADKAAGTGRYWRVRTVLWAALYQPVTVGAETIYLSTGWARETWTPREPGAKTWLGTQDLGSRPRTAEDKAAWERAGSPKTFDLGRGDTVNGERIIRSTAPKKGELTEFGGGGQWEGLYGPVALDDLPTEPAALRAAIEKQLRDAQMETSDQTVFAVLGAMLTEAPAGPELRAAAFKVLSGLDGVTNAGPREDATGRPGVALELKRTSQVDAGTFQSRNWLILDPKTYELLGGGMKGSVVDEAGEPLIGKGGKEMDSAILEAGWTDEKPVAPGLR